MRKIEVKGLILVADAVGDDVEKEADALLEQVNLALQQAFSNICPQLGREELFAQYVEEEVAEPTRKSFKVAAVSSNRNSFGLRSMVVVARDGEAYRVLSNDLHVKRQGHAISVELRDRKVDWAALGYEVPEKLPDAPPEVVKEVWKSQEEATQ